MRMCSHMLGKGNWWKSTRRGEVCNYARAGGHDDADNSDGIIGDQNAGDDDDGDVWS